MAYATLARVQGLIANFTIDGESKPNSTQAQEIIDAISDEIDAVIGGIGVSTPVTAPASFVNRLAMLNAYGAAAAILHAKVPEAAGLGDTSIYAFHERRYQKGLEALRNDQDLPSELRTVMNPKTYLRRNPDEEEVLGDNEEKSFFKRDMVF